jgi:type III restriction enzyme
MALHPAFLHSPYAILDPVVRWLPGDGAASPEKLLPPLAAQLRCKVQGVRRQRLRRRG